MAYFSYKSIFFKIRKELLKQDQKKEEKRLEHEKRMMIARALHEAQKEKEQNESNLLSGESEGEKAVSA